MSALGLPLILVLIAVSAIGPMALNGVLPATTVIIADLGTRYELVQMVLTVYLFANLVSQLVMGSVADRWGRRPVMLLGLGIFTVGSIACASAESIEWLLISRFVQGVGGAVCVFLPRTVVRDIHARDKAASVIGYMTTAMMIAPLFAPALGGWVTDNLNWRIMYLGLAGLSTILMVLAYRYQYETLKPRQTSPDSLQQQGSFISTSMTLMKEPAFVACSVMQAGAVGVYYGFLAGAPYVAMESRNMDASSYGIWFSMVACGYLSGNLIAGRYSEKLGVMRMVVLGAVPFVIGVALFWIGLAIDHPVALFLPMLVIALSNGMSLPSMFSMAMSARPELAASASALAGSLQTAVGVVLTIVVGYLLPLSDLWLFAIITLTMILSLAGLFWSARIHRSASGSSAGH